MDVHRPCIAGEVTPVIHVNAQLHEEHGDDHEQVQVPVLIHACKILSREHSA
jgi:hypothetical protein